MSLQLIGAPTQLQKRVCARLLSSQSAAELQMIRACECDTPLHGTFAEQRVCSRRMSDRAHGAQQDTHQHDEDGIELLAPIDTTLHGAATRRSQHGDIHGPAPAGGVFYRVVDSLHHLLGFSKASRPGGSFVQLSSEDTDAYPSQGAGASLLM